ncbi:MAG TPA: hypothetical protein PK184_20645 [Phycisphaerae bacterium]|jgi:hypothetical protein|nr:hypothetical protein [Phycisphaerae bacterium]
MKSEHRLQVAEIRVVYLINSKKWTSLITVWMPHRKEVFGRIYDTKASAMRAARELRRQLSEPIAKAAFAEFDKFLEQLRKDA